MQVIKDVETPEAVDFSSDGIRVYITQGSENVLNVFDRKTGKLIKKVPISGFANDMKATKDRRLILVCIAENPGALDIIDAASLKRVKSIPTKSRLNNIVATPNGRYAVATSPEGKFATVFDLLAQQAAWQITFDRGVLVPAIESDPAERPIGPHYHPKEARATCGRLEATCD